MKRITDALLFSLITILVVIAIPFIMVSLVIVGIKFFWMTCFIAQKTGDFTPPKPKDQYDIALALPKDKV